jgi:hypothetical protein
MLNVKTNMIPVNKRGNCNHYKIIQNRSEQYTRKAQSHGTPENSHIGHYKHTLENINLKV